MNNTPETTDKGATTVALIYGTSLFGGALVLSIGYLLFRWYMRRQLRRLDVHFFHATVGVTAIQPPPLELPPPLEPPPAPRLTPREATMRNSIENTVIEMPSRCSMTYSEEPTPWLNLQSPS